jgi:y4mF family transcriptional regulator
MQLKNAAEFGSIVRMARKNVNLSQAKLAAAAGIGERFVRELEKGKSSCQLDKSLRVIALLGVKLEAILPPNIEGSEG